MSPVKGKITGEVEAHLIAYAFNNPPEGLCTETCQMVSVPFTPKYGSWFDIALVESASLPKRCLGKCRFDNLEDFNSELEKWECDKNAKQKGVEWKFTIEDASIKLKFEFPIIIFLVCQNTRLFILYIDQLTSLIY